MGAFNIKTLYSLSLHGVLSNRDFMTGNKWVTYITPTLQAESKNTFLFERILQRYTEQATFQQPYQNELVYPESHLFQGSLLLKPPSKETPEFPHDVIHECFLTTIRMIFGWILLGLATL